MRKKIVFPISLILTTCLFELVLHKKIICIYWPLVKLVTRIDLMSQSIKNLNAADKIYPSNKQTI